jgi:hypothetical protein
MCGIADKPMEILYSNPPSPSKKKVVCKISHFIKKR